jgi:3-isopropylmalate dehydrogenase
MDFRIAVLPGDGIGPEVTAEAVRVLSAIGSARGYRFVFSEHAIGGQAIERHGAPLPRATLEACLSAHAVLLGAVGAPQFDDMPVALRPEAGLLQLRQALGGFANVRPCVAYPELAEVSPFRPGAASTADVLIVRELLGGLYFCTPRGFENDRAAAFNTMRYSEEEIRRVARVAFRLAQQRRRKVTSVDKANVLETSQLWRRVVSQVAAEFPGVMLHHLYVDACAMRLMTAPEDFDVLLTENLFGDILSDEAAAFCGSLGMLPSATLGGAVDLYEPVHGSAPDLAGKGIANPLGAIACVALLLRYSLGSAEDAESVEEAIRGALGDGHRTADIAGPASLRVSTARMGAAVLETLEVILDRSRSYHAV